MIFDMIACLRGYMQCMNASKQGPEEESRDPTLSLRLDQRVFLQNHLPVVSGPDPGELLREVSSFHRDCMLRISRCIPEPTSSVNSTLYNNT
jgi:hypothetical protein